MCVFTFSIYFTLCIYYSVGPLHGDTEYSITADKEGYVLTRSEQKQGDFLASKLAEVIVQVCTLLL